jgi:hypothetical protein
MLATGAVAYYLHFQRHKSELVKQLGTYENAITGYQDWLDSRPLVNEKLNTFVGDTLGFDAEVVESRFRSGLNRMAASAGLVGDDTIVSQRGTLSAVKNPAVAQRVTEFRRFLNDERISSPDLYVIDAEIRGSGTLEAAVRLLALAQTQPWIWKVRGFTLTPQGNQTTMFDITVGVTTAVLPDLAPAAARAEVEGRTEVEPPPILDPDAEHVLATAAIVDRNVFAPPKPKPADPAPVVVTQADPTPATTDPSPPRPKPQPYHEWRLTGVSGSPTQGMLAWMQNVKTGSAVLLSPGEGVLDATLEEANTEQVVFRIGESRYRLALNETLADRHLLE